MSYKELNQSQYEMFIDDLKAIIEKNDTDSIKFTHSVKIKKELTNSNYNKKQISFTQILENGKEGSMGNKVYLDSKKKATIGIGLNLEAAGANKTWKDAFKKSIFLASNMEAFIHYAHNFSKGIKLTEEQLQNHTGADMEEVERVLNGNITDEEVMLLFIQSISSRKKEIQTLYKKYQELDLNERLAIEDIYFNGPRAAKGEFLACIREYCDLKKGNKSREEVLAALDTAVYWILVHSNGDAAANGVTFVSATPTSRAQRKKKHKKENGKWSDSRGLQVRRDVEAMMLSYLAKEDEDPYGGLTKVLERAKANLATLKAEKEKHKSNKGAIQITMEGIEVFNKKLATKKLYKKPLKALEDLIKNL